MRCRIVVLQDDLEIRPSRAAILGEKDLPFVFPGLELFLESGFSIPNKGFSQSLHLVVKRVMWNQRDGNTQVNCEVGGGNNFTKDEVFMALVKEYPQK